MPPWCRRPVLLLLCLTCFWLVRDARAQVCTGAWQPGGPLPGLDGSVYAALVLANGDVIVGGSFSVAGAQPARNVARYRPVSGEWSTLGLGLGGPVFALAQMPNGDVIAGGGFTGSGQFEMPYVARWNGSAWSALGTGFNAPVRALTVTPSGVLVAGGDFTATLLGTSMPRVARWNGTAWVALASPSSFLGDRVEALLALPNGEILAGGRFVRRPRR